MVVEEDLPLEALDLFPLPSHPFPLPPLPKLSPVLHRLLPYLLHPPYLSKLFLLLDFHLVLQG